MIESRCDGDELLGESDFPDYNSAERRYSVHVRDTLMNLLKGDQDSLALLARYPREPDRLGAIPVPVAINAQALRLHKVEQILSSSLRFLHDGSEGGPIAQSEDEARGVILQWRDFPTRFPHIVIERMDIYDAKRGDPVETLWRVYRVQNQHHNIRINRLLDAMNLGLELIKWGR